MINFHREDGEIKMLKICVICILFFVGVQGDGSFYVMNTPNSLLFQSDSIILPSDQVVDVLNAVKGESVSESADFPGVVIKDPFSLPQQALLVHVRGVKELRLNDSKVRYPVEGESVSASLDDMKLSWVESHPICDINLSNPQENELSNCGMDVQPVAVSSNILIQDDIQNPVLGAIATLNGIANSVQKLVNSNKEFIFIEIDAYDALKLANNAEESKIISLLSNALNTIQHQIQSELDNSVLYVVISDVEEKERNFSRKRRDVNAASNDNTYNLATYYDQNYPVIFNIVLWFMVALGFSLLAICYAIADMDPGRDSIIYRMTSTRMKKDN